MARRSQRLDSWVTSKSNDTHTASMFTGWPYLVAPFGLALHKPSPHQYILQYVVSFFSLLSSDLSWGFMAHVFRQGESRLRSCLNGLSGMGSSVPPPMVYSSSSLFSYSVLSEAAGYQQHHMDI